MEILGKSKDSGLGVKLFEKCLFLSTKCLKNVNLGEKLADLEKFYAPPQKFLRIACSTPTPNLVRMGVLLQCALYKTKCAVINF
jgi:hypothetical protein